MSDLDAILRRIRPDITAFRDRQREAIERVVRHRNTLCLMPTGLGKSLIFEVAAEALGAACVVVSPLIALMGQQAGRLESGRSSVSLGGMGAQQATEQLRKWSFEKPSFLFTSPERLEDDSYLEYRLRAHRGNIGLIVVDEVHCVSQWGHGFRPPYKTIPRVLDRVFGRGGWPPVLCLTATLSARDQVEVQADFRIDDADVVRSASMRRENLDLTCEIVANEPAKVARLEAILEQHRDEKLIVYTHRKRSERYGTKALASHFEGLGHVARPFDADMTGKEKDEVLDGFTAGNIRVVFATGAFGMGIDIPDIRGVIHYLLPESIEQYHQEVGRAGRDQLPGFGHLLFTEKNAEVRRDLVEASRVTAEEIFAFYERAIRGMHEVIPRSTFLSDQEHAWFYAVEREGGVRVLGKGPTSIRCFAQTSRGSPEFVRFASATKRGIVSLIARKLELPVADLVATLNRLFDERQILLERAPDRGVFIEDGTFSPEVAAAVADGINATVDARLAGVDRLADAIRAGTLAS